MEFVRQSVSGRGHDGKHDGVVRGPWTRSVPVGTVAETAQRGILNGMERLVPQFQ